VNSTEEVLKWYDIKAESHETVTIEARIMDEIGGSGESAEDFINKIEDFGKIDVLNLGLLSPGGLIVEGMAIFDFLVRLQNQGIIVNTRAIGAVASMASVILMAPANFDGKITMSANAHIMIHNPFVGLEGDAEELRKMADDLDMFKGQIIRAYMNQTHLPEKKLSEFMKDAKRFTAEESLEFGFIDEIEGAVEAAAKWNMLDYNFVNQAEVQTLILSKERFEDRKEARKWVKRQRKDFKTGKVDENENSFRFRQFNPSECSSRPSTITLTDGVKAVICNRNSEGENMDGKEFCDVVIGQRLATVMNSRIDAMVSDEVSRAQILETMASNAGVDIDTVNQILRGEFNCPPLNRLSGFAQALDVEFSRLRQAAETDGCNYDNEENKETGKMKDDKFKNENDAEKDEELNEDSTEETEEKEGKDDSAEDSKSEESEDSEDSEDSEESKDKDSEKKKDEPEDKSDKDFNAKAEIDNFVNLYKEQTETLKNAIGVIDTLSAENKELKEKVKRHTIGGLGYEKNASDENSKSAQFKAIEDPAEKQVFYRQHKEAIKNGK